MKKIKVAIVGGGPAGLTAALTLSKRGITPIVFEEHSSIGQPIQCGEGVSIGAFEDLSLSPKKCDFVVRDFKDAKIHFPSNTQIYGDIHSFMIKRDEFDSYLAEKAIENGSEIRLSSKIIELKRKKEHIELVVSGNSKEHYECEYVILAEGSRANLARSMGFDTPISIRAFEYKIKGEWGDDLKFYFDAKRSPYGYCWIFPRDNETNVGIVTTAQNRKERLDNFLKECNIPRDILKKVGGIIPMKGPVNKLHGDRILLVGDTAGMVNPLFYGGIRLGMTSGRIAGEFLSTVLLYGEKAQISDFGDYQKNLQKYKFMSTLNLKCHEFFYSCSNAVLAKIGQVFNKQYINRIEGIRILKTLAKISTKPSLLFHPVGLYYLYRGFKIARDWGF